MKNESESTGPKCLVDAEYDPTDASYPSQFSYLVNTIIVMVLTVPAVLLNTMIIIR